MTLNNPITELNEWRKDRRDDKQTKKENRAYFWKDLKDETVDLKEQAGKLLGRSSSSQPASNNAYYPGQSGGSTYGTQPPASQNGYTDPNAGSCYGDQYQQNQPPADQAFAGYPSGPASGYGQSAYQQGPPQATLAYSQPHSAQSANYPAPPPQSSYDPSLYGNQQHSFNNTGQPYDTQTSNYQVGQQQQPTSAPSGRERLNLPNSPFSVSQTASPAPSYQSFSAPSPGQQGYPGQTDYSQTQQQYPQASNYSTSSYGAPQPGQHGYDSSWGNNPPY